MNKYYNRAWLACKQRNSAYFFTKIFVLYTDCPIEKRKQIRGNIKPSSLIEVVDNKKITQDAVYARYSACYMVWGFTL